MAQEAIHHTGLLMTLEEGHRFSRALSEASCALDEAATAFDALADLIDREELPKSHLFALARLAGKGMAHSNDTHGETLLVMYDRLNGEIRHSEKLAADFHEREAAQGGGDHDGA